MLEEWELPLGYSGSMYADSQTRKKLAQESGRFNLEKYPIFKELFPGKRKNYKSNLLHNFYKILYSKNWPPISRSRGQKILKAGGSGRGRIRTDDGQNF